MASCIKCNKDVGCSCNLFNGSCISCLTIKDNNQVLLDNIEFNKSLNFTKIEEVCKSKMNIEEKLNRINNIINKVQ